MDLKTRLESHPVATLKKEISKTNVKGYSKMKKAEVVALMLKNKDRFNHIKHANEPTPVKRTIKVKKTEEPKKLIEKLIPGINVNKDKGLKPLPKEFIPDEKSLKDMKKYKSILDKKFKDKKISVGEYKRIIEGVKKQIKILEKPKKEEMHPDGIHMHINWKDGKKELKKYKTQKLGEADFKKIRSERKEKRDYKTMKLMDGLKVLEYSA